MATPVTLDLNFAGVTKVNGRPSLLTGILRQLCPRCRCGSIFQRSILRGLPKMATECSVCGLKFEREEGYFLGAMYISYGLALLTIALLAAILWAFDRRLFPDIFWAVVLFLPCSPILTLFARVLWIYLDQAIDPERRA
jgi:uncharacterized protein (DUF983 family)